MYCTNTGMSYRYSISIMWDISKGYLCKTTGCGVLTFQISNKGIESKNHLQISLHQFDSLFSLFQIQQQE
jgi:hypothetical protein